jgi:hypothetical protein
MLCSSMLAIAAATCCLGQPDHTQSKRGCLMSLLLLLLLLLLQAS